jgi:hypothetical protein
MADTATDVRVVAAAEPGSLAAEANAAVRPVYHAFPTSSRHGVDGRQIDLSAQFIELMEKLGIAYDVVRVGPARRARKTLKAVS